MADIPFVQARWYTPSVRRVIDLIVIHDMEYPERLDSAEQVAQYFARGSAQASAHFNVDSDSVVQSVKLMDVAWAAPGANHNGVQIEHAGYARQTAADWADEYSEKMLHVSAALTADLCVKFKLPHAFVDAAGLLKGFRGFTTHAEVSKAWKKTTHTDPGPNFPMAHYLDLVKAAAGPAPIPQEVRAVVNAPVVGIMKHPSWDGYIQIGADYGTFSHQAPNYGSAAGGVQENAPCVGGAVHPSGDGYWLVGADGGVFPFAKTPEMAGTMFHGSLGSTKLNKPIVGMISSATGDGYALTASDGGVFGFGDEDYEGSVEYKG